MRANKKQIQKKVNMPHVVLFTLFIFVKKKKSSHIQGPISKKLLPIFAFFRNFCRGSAFGSTMIPGGCLSKKKKFFFSTYLIGVLKKQKKILKKQIEKIFWQFKVEEI